LISRNPNISEEYIATKIAEVSEKFIRDNKLTDDDFKWQETGSAFSVSKGDVDKVCKYILNQKEHHRKITFQEEYDKFIEFYEKTIRPIE
jgi:hypothetical protein